MKFKWKRILGVALSAVIAVSCLTGCGKKSGKSDELLFYVMGSEGRDMGWVFSEVNRIVEEKTGYKLNVQLLTTDNYDLTLSSGEPYDLIYAPDWLNYWENAAKGAFADISDEDLKKHAPYIWENGGEALKTTKYKGVRYGVAGTKRERNNRTFVARGDLMKKYGISDLNSKENLEKYLIAVAKNEPDMIPFDLPGTQSYLLTAMFASDWDWIPVGTVSYGEPVYFHENDPEHKLFIAAEQPELKEFSETMKRWNDNGVFSKSVMSSKTQSLDSFKSGRSALGMINTLNDCQTTWNELNADDRKAWDIKFYPRYYEHQLLDSYNNSITAISAFSSNKEAALEVLNAMYESEEINRLLSYGIEGTHYELTEDNKVRVLDQASFGWINFGIANEKYALEPAIDFPGAEELEKRFKEMDRSNLAVNCPISDEGIREIKLALSQVYDKYSAPRCYGIVMGTVDEAIAKEIDELKKAGIDKYIENLQSQLDSFMADIEG